MEKLDNADRHEGCELTVVPSKINDREVLPMENPNAPFQKTAKSAKQGRKPKGSRIKWVKSNDIEVLLKSPSAPENSVIKRKFRGKRAQGRSLENRPSNCYLYSLRTS